MATSTDKPNTAVEHFLAHYGVKGMRWGKRKGATSPGKKTSESEGSSSEDHSTARQLKARPARSLSNKELQALNTRLQLEKTHAELMRQTTTVSKGRKFVKGTLATAGTVQQVYSMVNSPLGKTVAEALKTLR